MDRRAGPTAAGILTIGLILAVARRLGADRAVKISAASRIDDGATGPPFLAIGPVPRRSPPPRGAFYEHRDRRDLPVGTRIYYIGGGEEWQRPGEPGPVGRVPDIIIVPDSAVIR